MSLCPTLREEWLVRITLVCGRDPLVSGDQVAGRASPSTQHLKSISFLVRRGLRLPELGPGEQPKASIMRLLNPGRDSSVKVQHGYTAALPEAGSHACPSQGPPPIGFGNTRMALIPMLSSPLDEKLVLAALHILGAPAFMAVRTCPAKRGRGILFSNERGPLRSGRVEPLIGPVRVYPGIVQPCRNSRPVAGLMLRCKWAEVALEPKTPVNCKLGAGLWALRLRHRLNVFEASIEVLFRMSRRRRKSRSCSRPFGSSSPGRPQSPELSSRRQPRSPC